MGPKHSKKILTSVSILSTWYVTLSFGTIVGLLSGFIKPFAFRILEVN
jgi:hypothetical protein